MLQLTQQHRANLKQLAGYLLSLSEDCPSFDTSKFFFVLGLNSLGAKEEESHYFFKRKTLSECGAVACPIGQSGDAGLPMAWCSEEKTIDWFETARINFGIDYSLSVEDATAFNWMFGDEWEDTDNTPHGAAKRIHWFLDSGIPDDWKEQMFGTTDTLCYQQ